MNKITLNNEDYIKNPFNAHHRIEIESQHIHNVGSKKYIYDVIIIPGKHSWNNAKYFVNFFIAEGYRKPCIYECVKILKKLKDLGSKSKTWSFEMILDLDYFITSDFKQLGDEGNLVYVANVNDIVDDLSFNKSYCKKTHTSIEDYRIMLVKEI